MVPTISFDKNWQGYSPIDGKTPIHFLVGLVAGMSRLNASWATVVVIGFEAILITLEEASLAAPFEKRSAQSYGNQAVDTMFGILGVAVGESLRKKQEFQLAQQQQQQQRQMQQPPQIAPVSVPQDVQVAGLGAIVGQEFINTEFPIVKAKPVVGVRRNVSGYR